MADAALLVLAKQPVAGRVKTRLSPQLTPGDAAALHLAFVRDALELARRARAAGPRVRPVLYYSPARARAYFSALAPDFDLLPQVGRTLGERLDSGLTRCLAAGSRHAVVMASDSPTLPLDALLGAFEALASGADVVLGPTEDGGYYLIGLNRPAPRLLREVTMSTPHVLDETLALAEAEGLRAALLPRWYDVDTAEALARLRAELAGLPPEVAAATRGALDGLGG